MSHRYEIEIAGRTLSIETGDLAQQAGGAVTLRYGDTMLLGTATASTPRPGIDFFPLSVEFEERLYAAGRIPGSFFRREGRPTTAAILSARLTDRPLRPLFPKGYKDDTQLVITVLSVDMENPPDTLGTIAASAALSVSDIPFDGPIASVRVGHVDGELVLQPTFEQLPNSDLNLIVSGTKDAITMVEAEAGEVSESLLLEALAMGQEAVSRIVEIQEQMAADAGKPKRAFEPPTVDPAVRSAVEEQIGADLEAALAAASGHSKAEREERVDELRKSVTDGLDEDADADAHKDAFRDIEKRIVRANILEKGERPDGRSPTDIRPLSATVGIVPRTHGSGLFQRGETQVLSLTTLAGTGMVQRLDDLTPEDTKRFMHHYNFPPFSVGETGRLSTGRREIGHGMLGERAMQSVLPPFEEFPYTIRIVSEVLSSNGSTSMASVCASVLSMMDAGIPIRTPIAGVAMGMIKGDDDVAVLTDIAGIEDFLGDMDFKVAGSKKGVTALQMDMKVKGIDLDILERALEQAREARLQIMDVMLECLPEPRESMSPHAPRIFRVDVPPDKIGMIIGPGGKSIRALEEETGANVDIEDSGAVYVNAVDAAAAEAAVERIRAVTKEVEPGEVYTGKVVRIVPFGAFVELVPGKDALVHISELADYRVGKVEDIAEMGDEMKVVVTEIDSMGRINASRRALLGGDGTGGGRDGDGDGDGGDGRRDRGPRGDRDRDRDGERDRGRGRARRSRGDREDRPAREDPPPRAERDDRPARAEREDGPAADEPEPETADAPVAEETSDDAISVEAPIARESASDAEAAAEAEADSVDEEAVAAAAAPAESAAPAEDRRDSGPDDRRDAGPDGDGERRPRRRRRRRRKAGGTGGTGGQGQNQDRNRNRDRDRDSDRGERQPDSNAGSSRSSRNRSIFSRVGLRRNASNDEPGPPPPPRPDFGAPGR